MWPALCAQRTKHAISPFSCGLVGAYTHTRKHAFSILKFILSFPVTQLVIIVRDDTHWFRRRSHLNTQILSLLYTFLHALHALLFFYRCRCDYECVCVCMSVRCAFFINLFSEREKKKSRRKYFFSQPAGRFQACLIFYFFFAPHSFCIVYLN